MSISRFVRCFLLYVLRRGIVKREGAVPIKPVCGVQEDTIPGHSPFYHFPTKGYGGQGRGRRKKSRAEWLGIFPVTIELRPRG